MPLEVARSIHRWSTAGTSEELHETWVRTACTGTKGKLHLWVVSEGSLPLHVIGLAHGCVRGFLWMSQSWHQRRAGPGSERQAGGLRRGAEVSHVCEAGWSGAWGWLRGAVAGVRDQTETNNRWGGGRIWGGTVDSVGVWLGARRVQRRGKRKQGDWAESSRACWSPRGKWAQEGIFQVGRAIWAQARRCERTQHIWGIWSRWTWLDCKAWGGEGGMWLER